VLTTSLVLTLRTWRVKFATDTVRLEPDTTTVRGAGLQACEGEAEAPRHSHETRSSVRLEADRPATGGLQADHPVQADQGARA
jgi:hypothetical protein